MKASCDVGTRATLSNWSTCLAVGSKALVTGRLQCSHFSQRQNLVISDISWPIFITVQSVVNTAENGCTMIFCCIPVGKVAITTCLFRHTFASASHPLSSPWLRLFGAVGLRASIKHQEARRTPCERLRNHNVLFHFAHTHIYLYILI